MLKSTDDEKSVRSIEKLMSVPNWTIFYQDSLVQLLSKMVVIAGIEAQVLAAANSGNFTGALLDAIGDIPDDAPDHPAALPVAFAMIGNLDAIAHYSLSINDMIVACRDRGDIQALFNALSVDSLISTMPFFQASLRWGQLAGDHSLGAEIFTAIRGPHKKRSIYPVLRWAEYLLRDQGALESCTQDEIHELIVMHLKLYGDDNQLKDSKKSLFMLFRKWQKEAGI
ncbi:hypothetical protein DT603_12185 [Pseudoxanthomonas gei]|uniref:Uncharacterized protein n=2 Tax=Pseudoxanthomonas gei TaxID=1383030 RepID=A0ABX0AHA0_9GAMM|nr:hypothetical protein [Pseudoxanthomonas gei]